MTDDNQHCPKCNALHTAEDINGGRCTSCGTMLCAVHMATITGFEIVDHGIDRAQYCQGCGTVFSSFEHVVTGNGDTFAEAIEDALESMSQGDETNGVDFDAFKREIASEGYGAVGQDGKVTWNLSQSVMDHLSTSDAELDESDLYYYVSIRYNVGL